MERVGPACREDTPPLDVTATRYWECRYFFPIYVNVLPGVFRNKHYFPFLLIVFLILDVNSRFAKFPYCHRRVLRESGWLFSALGI